MIDPEDDDETHDPILLDQDGFLTMDADVVGENFMAFQEWMARQEERIAQGLEIEPPPWDKETTR